MDKFDLAILERLRANAKQPIASIGDEVGLSRTAVNERIRKLEDSGVIQGYTIRERHTKDNHKVAVYFELTFRPFNVSEIKAAILQIPAIVKAYALSGDSDLIVHVEANNMDEISAVRELLVALPNLDKLITKMPFEQIK